LTERKRSEATVTDPEAPPQSPDVNAVRFVEEEVPAATPPSPKPPDFRVIFDAECGYVWQTLRRLGVQERDLEDVTHDVFVTVYRRLADYDAARPIRPWLFGIAYRVASDYRRLARHRREVVTAIGGDGIEPADDRPGADDHYEAAQARRVVLEALETMDIDRRAVFVMHELDGHAMPEIARALSVPLNTAYSRLRLAREQFAVAVRRIRARGISAPPGRAMNVSVGKSPSGSPGPRGGGER
jgi:RNA polymerase sigma-70 factor, ECF subfamily